MAALQGYKTVIAMGIALAAALYQQFVGPLPVVDQNLWNILVPVVGIGLRAVTKTPLGVKAPTQE